jgi:hypothetical protein
MLKEHVTTAIRDRDLSVENVETEKLTTPVLISYGNVRTDKYVC